DCQSGDKSPNGRIAGGRRRGMGSKLCSRIVIEHQGLRRSAPARSAVCVLLENQGRFDRHVYSRINGVPKRGRGRLASRNRTAGFAKQSEIHGQARSEEHTSEL